MKKLLLLLLISLFILTPLNCVNQNDKILFNKKMAKLSKESTTITSDKNNNIYLYNFGFGIIEILIQKEISN